MNIAFATKLAIALVSSVVAHSSSTDDLSEMQSLTQLYHDLSTPLLQDIISQDVDMTDQKQNSDVQPHTQATQNDKKHISWITTMLETYSNPTQQTQTATSQGALPHIGTFLNIHTSQTQPTHTTEPDLAAMTAFLGDHPELAQQTTVTPQETDNTQAANIDTTRQKAYKCSNCDKRYGTSDTLYQHMRRIHGITKKTGKVLCDMCGNKFVSEITLKRHQKDVHVKNCDVCGEVLKCESSLQAHKKMHDLNRYTCHVCHKTYSNSSSLGKHLRIHRDKDRVSDISMRQKACPICSRICEKGDDLANHIRSEHPTQVSTDPDLLVVYPCDECTTVCFSKAGLTNHKNRLHPKGSAASNS